MKPQLIQYVIFGFLLVPVAAGLIRRDRLDSARLWVMLWCCLQFIANLATRYLGARHIPSHPVTYIFVPLEGAAILWGLSLWQVRPTARLTLRILIPLFLVAWIVLTLTIENIRNFSVVSEPVYCILGLGAAAYTLLSRSALESGSLMARDWFWICTGLMMHFSSIAVLTPLGAKYALTNPQIVLRAFVIVAGINILAYSIITVGFLCPLSPSGHSSSPPS